MYPTFRTVPIKRLVLGAELRPQTTHVDVDRAGAAEEVVAPHFLQQLCPGEYPTGMLREVLEQLEFLVSQIKGPSTQSCGVRPLVDNQFAQRDLSRRFRTGNTAAAGDQQPQSGVQLSRTGTGKQDVVQPPVGVDGNESAFGEDGDHRYCGACASEQSTQPACGS